MRLALWRSLWIKCVVVGDGVVCVRRLWLGYGLLQAAMGVGVSWSVLGG